MSQLWINSGVWVFVCSLPLSWVGHIQRAKCVKNLLNLRNQIIIFLSGSCPCVCDCDHGDGGEAVQQPVHHRGGPEEAAGGGQGGQHRGGHPQDCHGRLKKLRLKCNMWVEKINVKIVNC